MSRLPRWEQCIVDILDKDALYEVYLNNQKVSFSDAYQEALKGINSRPIYTELRTPITRFMTLATIILSIIAYREGGITVFFPALSLLVWCFLHTIPYVLALWDTQKFRYEKGTMNKETYTKYAHLDATTRIQGVVTIAIDDNITAGSVKSRIRQAKNHLRLLQTGTERDKTKLAQVLELDKNAEELLKCITDEILALLEKNDTQSLIRACIKEEPVKERFAKKIADKCIFTYNCRSKLAGLLEQAVQEAINTNTVSNEIAEELKKLLANMNRQYDKLTTTSIRKTA
jgi:hypothetical protein